jgi:hypothetical protein
MVVQVDERLIGPELGPELGPEQRANRAHHLWYVAPARLSNYQRPAPSDVGELNAETRSQIKVNQRKETNAD